MIKILIVDDEKGWINFNTAAVCEVLGNETDIYTALSAQEGYSKVLENMKNPYDYILTDMQMENDYAPKMAGEWLIEQIQNLTAYYGTRVIIISASPKIKYIAKSYGVDFIPKPLATTSLEPYKELLSD